MILRCCTLLVQRSPFRGDVRRHTRDLLKRRELQSGELKYLMVMEKMRKLGGRKVVLSKSELAG